ncbi:PstA family ABC transporter permease [Pseudodesulfovibrio sp.]|uniref:PstA family ABC transporter permease n=1 Tax=unclassified Pseudodesulfovibrio TaxID=2661612 RepID=UPI003B00FD08
MNRQPVFTLFCRLSAVLPVLIVVGLLGFLWMQSRPAIGLSLFFGDTPPLEALFRFAPVWDGIWPACVGTFCLVGIAALTAVPMGILSGVYLSEYATGRSARVLSVLVDILAGAPSILMGLFGFALILYLRHSIAPAANTGMLLSGVCLGLLVLPYMINATSTTLEALPADLRLVGPSLGLTRWQSIRHILLPSAGRGIMSGVVLSIGRAAEDTAVIMLTGVVANAGLPRSVLGVYEALPFYIYTTAAEYRGPEDLQRGFGAALVLLGLTTLLFLAAGTLHRAMEYRWRKGA